MRRVFVVVVLLGVMRVLQGLRVQSLGDAETHTLTLAAIGFVVLAAFALAELGVRIGLPKVSGFILVGVVLGPSSANLLSDQVVGELEMFSTLALGLIATTAGLELELASLRRSLVTLVTTVAAKMVTCIVLVGGTLVALDYFETGWIEVGSQPELWALALLLGVLAWGTSPAISIAIIEETRAKGRITELVLGAAVLKDLVVVVGLAVALAVAQGLTSGEAAHAGALAHVARELAASMLAGALLGGLLIFYIHFVHAEMLLFVAAMVLVIAEISEALHLELLLVFIVAGFVVRNCSKYEHELLDPLQTISLPVFIVFFTTVGAGVDLRTTLALLPVALLLCLARVLAFFISGHIGSFFGREAPKVARLVWLGYLPQAGVTLGLLGIAVSQMGALGPTIASLGMACVSVNLLVGPVALRVALRRGQEIPGESESESGASAEAENSGEGGAPELSGSSAGLSRSAAAGDDEAGESNGNLSDELAPPLAEQLQSLQDGLASVIATDSEDHREECLTPWLKLFGALPTTTEAEFGEQIVWVERMIHEALERMGPADPVRALATLLDLTHVLEEVDENVAVPLEDQHRNAQPHDRRRLRWRKRWLSAWAWISGRAHRRVRRVPTRAIARTVLELELAKSQAATLVRWQQLEVELAVELRKFALGTKPRNQLISSSVEVVERAAAEVEERRQTALDSAIASVRRHWARVGAPGHDGRGLAYSRVEPEISELCTRLRAEQDAWPRLRRAVAQSVALVVEVARVRARVREVLADQVLRPVREAHVHAIEDLDGMLERLSRTGAAVRKDEDEVTAGDSSAGSMRAEAGEQRERLQMKAAAVLPKPALRRLRASVARVRNAASNRTAATVIDTFIRSGEERVRIVPDLPHVLAQVWPTDAELVTIDVGDIKETRLSTTLGPTITQALDQTLLRFTGLRGEMLECANLVAFVASAREPQEQESGGSWQQSLKSALSQAGKRLEVARSSFESVFDDLAAALDSALDVLGEGLLQGVDERAHAGPRAGGARQKSKDVWHRLVDRAAFRLRRTRVGSQRVLRRARDWWSSKRSARAAGLNLPDLGDAAAVRRYLARRAPGPVDASTPAIYSALFSGAELHDPRLFALHRSGLETLTAAERAWQADPTRGNAALIVAGVGVGKSSLLNVAELKLASRRVVTLRDASQSEESLLEVLADEMGCACSLAALTRAFGREHGLMVIDDLHHWLSPSHAGIDTLERLAQLVYATRASTFWLVSCLAETHALFDELVGLRSAFSHTVRLGDIAPAQLEDVVSSRHSLSGLPLRIGPAAAGTAVGVLRWRTSSPRQRFFADLHAASGGSTRRAIELWLAHARGGADEGVEMVSVQSTRGDLALLANMPSEDLVLLSLLLRHGPRSAATLAKWLDEPRRVVERSCAHLEVLGFLCVVAHDDAAGFERFSVKPAMSDLVATSLRELSLWSQR